MNRGLNFGCADAIRALAPNYISELSRQSGIMKSSFAARRNQCEEVAIIRAPAGAELSGFAFALRDCTSHDGP
jgi:hypothetical protein